MSRVRNPATMILVHLLRTNTKAERSIRGISEVTGVSRTAVRNNLLVMERHNSATDPGWVGREKGRPMTWVLTDKGRVVARDRARRSS
jgi:predicted ArsR family transcriptional regulator